MEATEVFIKGILSCREFPIVAVKSYQIDGFIMGYHVYKTAWTPCIKKVLCGVMESTNLMGKYAVAVQRNDGQLVVDLPPGKSGKFTKTIFYFFKA